jgi:hypothetical protein
LSYWVTIFTDETWARTADRGFRVVGFPPPTPGRGGYAESTFRKVHAQDILVCYVKAPARRWVGMLRVEGPWFIDEQDPTWGRDEQGKVKLPARFPTHPLVSHPVERGVPMSEVTDALTSLDTHPGGRSFRRSLGRVPDEVGELLSELLGRERQPSPARVPRRQRATGEGASVPDGRRSADPPSRSRGAVHRELVWNLIVLGRNFGCGVWVAADQRRKSWDGEIFGNHVLGGFPDAALDPDWVAAMCSLDVVWLSSNRVVTAFEVEATANVSSGVLRLSDVLALRADAPIDLFVVAPDKLAQSVLTELGRPTFEAFEPPLRERCHYLSASSLRAAIVRSEQPNSGGSVPDLVRDFAEQVAQAI